MIKLLGEKANKSEIEAVVREADDNGDGTVDFEGERRRHRKVFYHDPGDDDFLVDLSASSDRLNSEYLIFY